MSLTRKIVIWGAVAAATIVPVAEAAISPLLAWRQPIYVVAGFAGIIAMTLLLIQPLLARGYLPGFPGSSGRRAHRWTGGVLIAAVVVHVAGLWITSPPDVVDALLFASPTPFSAWGVAAMWALVAASLLAAVRRRLRLQVRVWRLGHTGLVTVAVLGSVAHAMLIEGTMGTVSKTALCALVLASTAKAVTDFRIWKTWVVRGR